MEKKIFIQFGRKAEVESRKLEVGRSSSVFAEWMYAKFKIKGLNNSRLN